MSSMVVRAPDGRPRCAIATEYEHRGALRTSFVVLEPQETLIPRGRLAYGFAQHCADRPFVELESWLREQGYQFGLGYRAPP